jgi:hypothetical protein
MLRKLGGWEWPSTDVPCSFRAGSEYRHRVVVVVGHVDGFGLRVHCNPSGKWPTGMVAVTVLVRALITDTVLSALLVT